MHQEKLKTAAPMPKDEESIAKNSMKLYTYLVCIAGLANYPENTRIFRQKNLMLTKIYNATGITDKTIKLYLAFLEYNNKVEYKGKYHFNYEYILSYYEAQTDSKLKSERSSRRKALLDHAAEVWKKRNKEEKEGIYWIRRPNPYTPIPEETLSQLNSFFKASELEFKLYLLCCGIRDNCCYKGISSVNISFEQIRDTFNYAKDKDIDNEIRRSLFFLKELKLIDFEETYYVNRKLMRIPCFKLVDVNYWIAYERKEIEKLDLTNEELKEIYQRIENCYN